MATYPKNSYSDYTIGWICALPLEMAAAKAMLDEIHPPLPRNPSDDNIYTLGTLQGHNIVIACLPSGVYGLSSATTVAIRMTNTFQAIRFGLMVGIGGGVPSKYADIRLGDIVVSKPSGTFGGVVQYDYGKTIGSGRFQRTGSLNKPPPTLLAALADLEANLMIGLSQIPAHLGQMLTRYPAMSRIFSYPGPQQDVLFEAEHAHVNNPLDDNGTCRDCSASRVVPRPPRPSPDHPRIHYGLIASGNQVMRDGVTRDRVSRDLGGSSGILCFEMEAAGLMDHFPCLVIRGICDYSDSHKNKQWQAYAAAVAAAYAKELLAVIPAWQTPVQSDMVDSGVSVRDKRKPWHDETVEDRSGRPLQGQAVQVCSILS